MQQDFQAQGGDDIKHYDKSNGIKNVENINEIAPILLKKPNNRKILFGHKWTGEHYFKWILNKPKYIQASVPD